MVSTYTSSVLLWTLRSHGQLFLDTVLMQPIGEDFVSP